VSITRVGVTVGLPVYNGERFIEHAVEATLTQTYGDLELVISDNASTDGTEALCRGWAARDRRVRYVRSPVNRGAAWNHSRLVDLAEGKYFKWLAADDCYDREYLARCVEVLETHPGVVLVCTRTTFIDESGRSVKRNDPGWDLRSEAPHERLRAVILKGGHWTNADALFGVMRTNALRSTRLFPRYQGGDKRPLAELSLVGQFVEIPEYLLSRRLHGDASSMNNPSTSGYDRKSVLWMAEYFKGSKWRICLPTWSLALDHLVTIWRSGFGPREKMGLMSAVIKAGWWQRRFLAEELGAAARMLIEGHEVRHDRWRTWEPPLA
jgi:glycosyltransferase involved in cell wall biosynthesis